jgi:hypothetical protein
MRDKLQRCIVNRIDRLRNMMNLRRRTGLLLPEYLHFARRQSLISSHATKSSALNWIFR